MAEFMKLQGFVLLLLAFGILDDAGSSMLVVAGLQLLLVLTYAWIELALAASTGRPDPATAAPTPVATRPPSVMAYIVALLTWPIAAWVLLYAAERYSLATTGAVWLPASTPLVAAILLALSAITVAALGFRRRSATQDQPDD